METLSAQNRENNHRDLIKINNTANGTFLYRESEEDRLHPEGRQWLPVEDLDTVPDGDVGEAYTYSPSTYCALAWNELRCLRRAYCCSSRYSSSPEIQNLVRC
jgi:hypothetical protein